MKVLIFNVRYSSNLGDGILAECLENELRRASPGTSVETVDLAGRCDYGASAGGRRAALTVLGILPANARRTAVAFMLERKLRALRPEWQSRIASVDAVVIGGGNLFQDDDLNFPLKIASVLDCVHRENRPIAVFAVGASAHWSARAVELFGGLIANRLVHISVRDHAARQNWLKHFGEARDVMVCPDPGLLARDLPMVRFRSQSPGPPLVGIGVTHPVILRRHCDRHPKEIPLASVEDYCRLAHWLADRGYRIMLFTNGADEDERFLAHVAKSLWRDSRMTAETLSVAPAPKRPDELIGVLRHTDAVIAHRLHASIVSYSLGIPHLGLGWDSKVENFCRAVGREAFFLCGADISAERIGTGLINAMKEGIDMQAHARHLADARAGVVLLAQQIRNAVEGGVSETA